MTAAVVVAAVLAVLAALVLDYALLRRVLPPVAEPMQVVSRSDGGTTGTNELTLVGEHGPEYASLPAGTSPNLAALSAALAAGSVLIIVGAVEAEHVRLPPGTVVHTAAETIEMLRSGRLGPEGTKAEHHGVKSEVDGDDLSGP